MKITRARSIICCAILVLLGLSAGLYPHLPAGVSVTGARAIQKGTARGDIEARLGPPLVVGPWVDGSRTDGSRLIGSFGVWELCDGWTTINFDLDDRTQMSGAYSENWVIRKKTRLWWALGW